MNKNIEIPDEPVDIMAEWNRSTARIRELEAALEAVEWITDDMSDGYCPWCNGRRYEQEVSNYNTYLHHGHTTDCLRRRALGQTP